MTYNFQASKDAFAENEVDFHCLCNLDAVIDVALKSGDITDEEKTSILRFRDDPGTWAST